MGTDRRHPGEDRKGERSGAPRRACATGAPVQPGGLPDAITFFVTRAERNAVLRELRGIDRDRGRALLSALGLGRVSG